MKADKHMEIWIGAYNAALTGLLAGRAGMILDINWSDPGEVATACRRFANQAVKDAEEHSSGLNTSQSRQAS
jgi:hypothetical protein